MKKYRGLLRGQSSALTLRLWEFTGTALLTLFIWIFLLIFLSPLFYMLVTSLKSADELRDRLAPFYPAEHLTYVYQGTTYQIFKVPIPDGAQHDWALVTPGRNSSQFIDPAHPEQGLITWNGYWRSLAGVFRFRTTWDNYVNIWKSVDYPHLFQNTLTIEALTELGMLLSSIAVAYGFSRFRVPGGRFLFFLLIATIVIPDSITLVPSYFIFARILPWNGTFYPLIVPAFFGNAIYIFLLRQNFRSIPRDLDEAAMLDGAGPLRTLISIILPQAVPAVVTVALLQFFNTWNELRLASLYLATRPDLQPISFSAQATINIGFTPEVAQTSAVMLIAIPLVILFLSQRFFMQDMVVTGMEK